MTRRYEFWYGGKLVGILKLTDERALDRIINRRWDLRPSGWQISELMEAMK